MKARTVVLIVAAISAVVVLVEVVGLLVGFILYNYGTPPIYNSSTIQKRT